MANDITTLAIQIQSQEAERSLQTFNALMLAGSQAAAKISNIAVNVDVSAAMAQIQALKSAAADSQMATGADTKATTITRQSSNALLELKKVVEALSYAYKNYSGDIAGLMAYEEALKIKINELANAYINVQNEADNLERKFDISISGADYAKQQYSAMQRQLESISSAPLDYVNGRMSELAGRTADAKVEVNELSSAFDGITEIAGGAISGLSIVSTIAGAFRLAPHPLVAAGAAVVGAGVSGISWMNKREQEKEKNSLQISKIAANSSSNAADYNARRNEEIWNGEVQRLIELNNMERLNTGEKKEILEIAQFLQNEYSGFNVELDASSGKVINLGKALTQLEAFQHEDNIAEYSNALEAARKHAEQLFNNVRKESSTLVPHYDKIVNSDFASGPKFQKLREQIAEQEEIYKVLSQSPAGGGWADMSMNLNGSELSSIQNAQTKKTLETLSELKEEFAREYVNAFSEHLLNDPGNELLYRKIMNELTTLHGEDLTPLITNLENAKNEGLLSIAENEQKINGDDPQERYKNELAALKEKNAEMTALLVLEDGEIKRLKTADDLYVERQKALTEINKKLAALQGMDDMDTLANGKKVGIYRQELENEKLEKTFANLQYDEEVGALRKNLYNEQKKYVYDQYGGIIRERSDEELSAMRQQEIAIAREKVNNARTPKEWLEAQMELQRLEVEEYNYSQQQMADSGLPAMQNEQRLSSTMIQGIEARSQESFALQARTFQRPENALNNMSESERRETEIRDCVIGYEQYLKNISDGSIALNDAITRL